MRKKSFFDGVRFIYEQLFHPVQCTAYRICQCGSRDKLVLPDMTASLSILDQFRYF